MVNRIELNRNSAESNRICFQPNCPALLCTRHPSTLQFSFSVCHLTDVVCVSKSIRSCLSRWIATANICQVYSLALLMF